MLLISPCTREEAVHENHPKAIGLNFALDNELGVFALGSETQAHNNLAFIQMKKKKKKHTHTGEPSHFRQLTIILVFLPPRLEAHLCLFLTEQDSLPLTANTHRLLQGLFLQLLFYSSHDRPTAQTTKPTSVHTGVHTARKLWG